MSSVLHWKDMENLTMGKSTSCGVVITDGNKLVVGHVTRGKWWDLPKGGMNPGESFLEAALRELNEETGLVVEDTSALTPLGVFLYKPKKDLVLYLWKVEQMPDPTSLVCKSTFKDSKGRDVKELDQFKVVTWQEAANLVNPDMQKVLKKVEKEI